MERCDHGFGENKSHNDLGGYVEIRGKDMI